ncbi:ATP-binding cassette domain-containing protein [Aliikangiella maris]|uniref:ABC transporter ATP-binding protein n=2 Tax=Aliikangiella maris TaxID=3162458 RepID=A0ABV3MSF0_9GAMM
MLKIEKLSYQVQGQNLVDNVSFQLPAPCRVAIVGLNGAGKSTLLNLIAGTIKATMGHIGFNQFMPSEQEYFEQCGYQAADMSAFSHLTGREYLELSCQLKNICDLSAIDKVVKVWDLQQLEIPMKKLSQGNLRKLMIAQAFLGEPKLVLLDEPSQALDPVEQQRFIDNIQQAGKYTLCLFSSHHINESVEIADYVLMFHHGKLIAQLALSDKQQLWLTSRLSLSSMQKLLPDLQVQCTHTNHSIYLYRVKLTPNYENDFVTQQLKCADSQYQLLGSSKNALMPLFTLLANQKL